MKAQEATAAPYQMAMNGTESLAQLNGYAAAAMAPATIPAVAPQRSKRVGAPRRSAQVKTASGIGERHYAKQTAHRGH